MDAILIFFHFHPTELNIQPAIKVAYKVKKWKKKKKFQNSIKFHSTSSADFRSLSNNKEEEEKRRERRRVAFRRESFHLKKKEEQFSSR